MENAERILMGISINQPEMEEEDLEGIEDKASYQYDIENILNSIGNDGFKEIYEIFISGIQILESKVQQEFCMRILEKISSVYDFEFPSKYDFLDENNINMLYEFIAFLEYKNLEFFSSVWKYLNVDLRKINIETYCKTNSKKIIREIEEQVELRNLNEMSSIFLRTYIKDDIIKFLIRITKKNKMLIVVNLLQGETE